VKKANLDRIGLEYAGSRRRGIRPGQLWKAIGFGVLVCLCARLVLALVEFAARIIG